LQHQKRRKNTKEVSRSHKIVSETGLITITGGKWTTTEKLPKTLLTKQSQFVIYLKCKTEHIPIHGNIITTLDRKTIYTFTEQIFLKY
jgi:glycerol-3-phosphate dehydrogenase